MRDLGNIVVLLSALMLSPLTLAESVQLQLDAPYIELHSGPAAGYPVIHVLEQVESVSVIRKRTSWLKVVDKRGNQGWIEQAQLGVLSLDGHPATAAAQQPQFAQRDLETGVMYGDLEGANFFNIYLDYALTPVFSTEVSLGRSLGSVADSTLYEAMLFSHLVPEWPLVPYIGIGGGYIDTEPHGVLADSESRGNTLMSAASGVKYHLTRNILIRAEYRFSLALTDRDENEEIETWKLGFSVFF